MKRIFSLYLIAIYFIAINSQSKKNVFKHGKYCITKSDCGKKLYCIFNACMTEFEKNNIDILGLNNQNFIDEENDKNELDKNAIKEANLLFTGSILLDGRAFKSGERGKDLYNYNHIFNKNITKKIKSVDLPVTNMQTIFYIKEDINDINFPLKINNTPKEFGDSLAYAGFRLILHASPFSFALKEKGIINTLNFWEANYPFIKILGISRNQKESEDNYYIYNINNIKIGIINFNAFKSDKIPEEKKYMVNTISKERVENIMNKIKNQTDFNIACINWGKKIGKFPDKKQIKIAKNLADFGIGVVIGNYPYYVQPVSFVQSDKGNKALVFWSLGIFVGDVDNNKNFWLGAMADIKFKKINGKVFVKKYKMIPIVNHIKENREYSVYKLDDYNNLIGKNIISKEKCENIFGVFSKC